MTNTLAYYSAELMAGVKSFAVQVPEASPITIIWSKFTHVCSKLDHFIAAHYFLITMKWPYPRKAKMSL